MQRYLDKNQTPLPMLFVNVVSCFNCILLNHVVFDTLMAGVDRKDTRVIKTFY